jgi:aminopeptidase
LLDIKYYFFNFRGVPKKGTVFVFNNLGTEFEAVAVSGLGDENAGFNEDEELNEKKENIRIAAGLGARALQSEVMEEKK